MIWPENISFDELFKKIDLWFDDERNFIGDPPIDAQFALDLIFKTLIDDKEDYLYLTELPESTKQTNSIMLHLILKKYSRKYRKFIKKRRKQNERNIV